MTMADEVLDFPKISNVGVRQALRIPVATVFLVFRKDVIDTIVGSIMGSRMGMVTADVVGTN